MSDNRQIETLWGMRPRIPGGIKVKKTVSKWLVAIVVAIATLGFSLPALAQSAVTTQNVDLRQEVYSLLTDMSNVRDGETWSHWIDQWNQVVRTQYNGANTDGMALGQVVEVPQSPADWDYVDWESVPYAARPSVALSHACGLMTGRVYADGSLAWDANEDLKRYEAANIAARTIELIFEVALNNAAYSRPGCPVSLEAFSGDPEMFKDLIERQGARHDKAVAELQAAIAKLQDRPDLSDEVKALTQKDLDLRVEFQSQMSALTDELNARWDDLKGEVGSLWIVLAEYDQKLQTLRQEIFDEVWALCANGACKGEQGPEGPRGLVGPQGPQGPAGRDADVDGLRDEFSSMLSDMRGDLVTQKEFRKDQARQDAATAALDARVTVIENTLGRISIDYCPVWLNFTGKAGVGEFDADNPYRPGMEVSANVGVNALDAEAGVQIVSYDVGRGNRPNDRADWWKESAWYESLPLGTVISITVRDATGATCTQTHSLMGN